MSQPIYKLFLARQTAAAYQLSPEERQTSAVLSSPGLAH
jgi:hypothetical protein